MSEPAHETAMTIAFNNIFSRLEQLELAQRSNAEAFSKIQIDLNDITQMRRDIANKLELFVDKIKGMSER